MSAALATGHGVPPGTVPSSMSQQFVTFWLEGEVFGLPLSEVQEIIRMPRIVRVPLAADSLEGIANLRGAVLPIISLRRVFAMTDTPHSDATRVVVVNRGSLAGYVIDRMASVITTEPRDIEPIEAVSGTIHTEMLQGMIKRDEGTIMLLNLPDLGGPDSAAERKVRPDTPVLELTAKPEARAEREPGGVIQLVSFEVSEQEYAFPIEDVQEIVQVPRRIIGVPRSDPHVMGVMTLRNRLLPLVSLRRMFDMPQAPLAEHNRIVVATFKAKAGSPPVSVGIVMDTVNEVLRVARSVVEQVPALLATQSGGAELAAICRLDGGRLVTILSVEKMFPVRVREELLDAARSAQTEELPVEDGGKMLEASDDEQFVIFRLGGEEFGVPIGAVQEIVRVPEQLTRVPKTPDFISGVVNLRGVVLPVVDQRRRFGLPEMVRNDRQRIMVLMVGAVRTGFVVDSVVEVLKVARSTIGPAPHLSEEQRKLIDRVANLEDHKRMLMLMRPERLLSVEEQVAVTGI